MNRRLDATTTVRVDTAGAAVFGGDPTSSVLSVLDRIVANVVSDPEAHAAPSSTPWTRRSRGSPAPSPTSAPATPAPSGWRRASGTPRSPATGRLAQVEEIDLPRTVLELQTQQVAYQASLAATAKVIQPTLMDFLR